MSDGSSQDRPINVAQELGADTGANGTATLVSGRVYPLAIAGIIRDLTKAHPLAMLGVAFFAGAAYAGRRHGRRR